MPIFSKASLLSGLFACALIGCSGADHALSATDEITEIPLQEVPASVSAVVKAQSAEFKMVEVLRKGRDGRIYYDVEGKLPNGDEIEFDVLMTKDGPKVVEIQRDILWRATPGPVRKTVAKANTEKQKVVRVIESKQADTDIIIYEIFIAGYPAKPRFEVSVDGDGPAKRLETPWKH